VAPLHQIRVSASCWLKPFFFSKSVATTGVCNHAALPGQMHMTRLVYGPELHVSSSAGRTIRWPPTKD